MVLSRSEERLFDVALEQEAAAAASRPSILERLREEERVRERNAAVRRAARAVPGGDEMIAKIDGLIAGSLAAAPELARARTIGERAAVARSVASTLPLGIEAFESFTREQELQKQNAPLRRALGGALANPIKRVPLGAKIQARPAPIEERVSGASAPRQAIDAPPGPARQPPQQGLSDAEEQLFAEALAVEHRQAADGTPSVMPQVREELRRQAVEAALFEPELAREASFGGPSEFARLQTQRRLAEEAARQLAGLGGVEDPGLLGEPRRASEPARQEEGVPPDELVNLYARLLAGENVSDRALALIGSYPKPVQAKTAAIAESDRLNTVVGAVAAERLRGGQIASRFDTVVSQVIDFGADLVAAGEGLGQGTDDGFHSVVSKFQSQLDAQRDALGAVGDFIQWWGPTEQTPQRIDEVRRELNRLTSAPGGSAPDLRCLTAEGVGRLHDGILAAVVEDTQGDLPVVAELKKIRAFVAGVKGNVEPRGTDHPALQVLPEGSLPREIGGWGVEQVTDPTFLLAGGGGLAVKVLPKAVTWIASGMLARGTRDALTGGCEDDS